MNQQNNDLLQFLGFEYYQEIEEYIKAVYLPYGSKKVLEQPVNLIEICLLVYILVQQENILYENHQNDRILIKHNFHEYEDIKLLKDTYPGLCDLIEKSSESGFIIILNSQNNILDFIQTKKGEKYDNF
ncbi:MAG: hypothetical protein ACPHY8_07015 [Patescibacteria group bacterium]